MGGGGGEKVADNADDTNLGAQRVSIGEHCHFVAVVVV